MKKEINTLKECLYSAGKIIKKYFKKIGYRLKGRANPVTEADILSQKAIFKIIRNNFPHYGFLSEESRYKKVPSEYLWVIDPLDGTLNYAHNFPHCCVSIALLKNQKPIIGGVYDPFREEIFLAVRGKGSFLNSRKITVSKTKKLTESLLLTGFGYDRAKKADFYCKFYAEFLKICHDVRRTGSAALDMAWLASGRVDGFWEFNLSPWDVAAGKLIVEEAGGKITDFKNKNWKNASDFGSQTLATNGRIHAQMLEVIKTGLNLADK